MPLEQRVIEQYLEFSQGTFGAMNCFYAQERNTLFTLCDFFET